MGAQTKPFRNIHITTCCTAFFGIISVIVGICEVCVWLAHLGYGILGTSFINHDGETVENRLGVSKGGLSGAGMVVLTACGIWCGIWVSNVIIIC